MSNPELTRSAGGASAAPAWPRSVDPAGRPILAFTDGRGGLEYMTHGAEDLRPLVLLQPLEFPAWPAPDFCRRAEQAGFRTISVRRPGFAAIPALPDLDRHVALVAAFLRDMGLDGAVLVCAGTTNPLGYRLARSPQVGLTVLGNCCFNYDPLVEIRPDWFARAVHDALTNAAGARMALIAMKSSEGVFGRYWVVENFMQKSPGDLAYLHANRALFAEAMDSIHDGLDVHTFAMELRSTLRQDPFLTDGCLAGANVVSVSGLETSERWQAGIRSEAARVGVPLHFFPSGDALVLLQSAGEFMELLLRYFN